MNKKLLDITIKLEGIHSTPKVDIEEVNVIGQNDKYFVVDNYTFSKHCHKKEKYGGYSAINEVIISDYTKDSTMKRIMGQFRIYMITDMTQKRAEIRINKEFNKFLSDKVGEYGAGVKVDIFKED